MKVVNVSSLLLGERAADLGIVKEGRVVEGTRGERDESGGGVDGVDWSLTSLIVILCSSCHICVLAAGYCTYR